MTADWLLVVVGLVIIIWLARNVEPEYRRQS